MPKRLLEPIFEGGIRHPHFFNGRRLTAEDLQAEQQAGRTARELLGLAVGPGIVYGLEVGELTPQILEVNAGLAFNRLGQPVRLPDKQSVTLVVPDPSLHADAGLFGDCGASVSLEVPGGTGVYMLVVSPVSGFEGRVPMSGFGSGGRMTGCGSRYAVEGVRFRIVPVLFHENVGDGATLRNRVAHHCFGTETYRERVGFPGPLLGGFFADPSEETGDRLSEIAPDLEPCDVPLAVFYWSGGRCVFVDNWAVRRRTTPPYPAGFGRPYVGEEMTAVAEAAFLQFQDEIASLLRDGGNYEKMQAHERFRYLPAAGFLPVGPRRFSPEAFFSRERFPEQIDVDGDRAFVREWLHRSLFVEPIDVEAPPVITLFHMGNEPYVFFMRRDMSRTRKDDGIRPGGGNDPKATGKLEIHLALAESIGGRIPGGAATGEVKEVVQPPNSEELRRELEETVQLRVRDAAGNEVELDLLWVESPLGKPAREPFARYGTGELSPGTYHAEMRAEGFRPMSVQVEVPTGQEVRHTFLLERDQPGNLRVTVPLKRL